MNRLRVLRPLCMLCLRRTLATVAHNPAKIGLTYHRRRFSAMATLFSPLPPRTAAAGAGDDPAARERLHADASMIPTPGRTAAQQLCEWWSARRLQHPLAARKAPCSPVSANIWPLRTFRSEGRRDFPRTPPRRERARCLTGLASGNPLTEEDEEAEEAHRIRKATTKEDVERRRERVLSGSAYVILYAIGSNLFVAATKAVAAHVTGSSAMLAEVFHSLADACNETFILWGIRRSEKPADLNHPYGFQRERYAWALVSGCGVFFLGCGVSLYHGIIGLLEPHQLSHPQIAFAVLGTSLCVEGVTMFKAMRQIQKSAAQTNVSFMKYLRQGADPTAVHVFVEDVAAVTGIAIAGTSLSVALMTGNPMWDSAGSVGVGLLLGYVATFLVKRNVRSIVETSMDQNRLEKAVSILRNDVTVKTVSDVKSTSLGPEWARFKAEVHFNGAEVAHRKVDAMTPDQVMQVLAQAQGLQTEQELKDFLIVHGEASIRQLAKELARIEARITDEVPEISHCDLEIY